jgi:predicted NUDIX family phosphoesterase
VTQIEELVYVVPTRLVMDGGSWRGVRQTGVSEILDIIRTRGRLAPRATMERDPSHKQIIPYLVLRDGDRYFRMRRTRAGADERLHDRYSIGVGGHLNPGDDGVEGGLYREWREELVADFVPSFELVGLLNDDETDVGSVHLGVVYVADAAGRPVAVRETHKLSGDFVAPSEVQAVHPRLETWSQLVFDVLEASRTG